MSITDELRDYALSFKNSNDSLGGIGDDLDQIADRIDEEHERAVMSAMNDALCHANEESMAKLGWVRLPKDADGVPIRVGDVMWQKDRITKRACKAIMGDAYVMLDGIQGAVYAKGLIHYHATTVEDVLREFGDWYAHTKGGCDEDGIFAEYAAKLRLAGEGE